MEREPNNITGFFRNRIIIITTSITLIILAIFIATQTFVALHNMLIPTASAANTITVSGKGTATSTPNVITLSYGVSTTAATVAAAQKKTTAIGNAAIVFLKQKGISDTDIKTASYNISPNYEYKNEPCGNNIICPKQTINGYKVSQNISVKVTNLKNIGILLQGLGHIGVTNLYASSPQVTNPTIYKNLARTRAITQAKASAIVLSQELGVHLGHLVRFTQSVNYPRPLYSRLETIHSGTDTPSFPTGESTYTSNVSLIYAIY